jgi:pimeloyl-ACP methyl ester carboxylesterase
MTYGLQIHTHQGDRCRLLCPATPNPRRPPFILLPGMDGTAQLQIEQAKDLAHLFDVRCVALPTHDLRPWADLIDEVLDLIDQEFSQQLGHIYVLGESFGGCLALKLALRSPQWFQHLVLVNPASSLERAPLIRWGAQMSQWIPEALYPQSCLGLLPFLAARSRISVRAQQQLLHAMQSVSQQTAQWRLSLLQQLNISDAQLRRLTLPTLIVASGRDRLLPSVAEAGRLEALLHQAKTYFLPDSGHACLIETDVSLRRILEVCDLVPGQQP